MNRNMWWLLGANLKSDYRVIIVWLLVNFSLIVSGALKLADLYNSPETLDQLLTMLRTPMMTAMLHGCQNYRSILLQSYMPQSCCRLWRY